MLLLKRFFCHLSVLGFVALGLQAAAWPQYLVPNRDGVYPGEALPRAWPSDGPKGLWRKRHISAGMSGVVVARGRAILFHEVNRYDTIECLDAKTGREQWRERIGSNHSASPTFVGGRLLFHSKEGETTVLKPGRKFEILARNKLDGAHHASAAVSDDALFLRTEKAIYKIEEQ